MTCSKVAREPMIKWPCVSVFQQAHKYAWSLEGPIALKQLKWGLCFEHPPMQNHLAVQIYIQLTPEYMGKVAV